MRLCLACDCSLDGRQVTARYCSARCRKRAQREREPVTPKKPPAGSVAPMRAPLDAFERLRGGLPLSQWKPDPRATGEGMPDIPDFLKRG
jgi:hypothetical protein